MALFSLTRSEYKPAESEREERLSPKPSQHAPDLKRRMAASPVLATFTTFADGSSVAECYRAKASDCRFLAALLIAILLSVPSIPNSR